MFRFRFQSLLQIATAQRDERQAALAEAIGRWKRIDEQRQQIAQQRRAASAERCGLRVGVLRLNSLLVHERFEQHLESEDRQLAAVAEPLQAEVDRCRETLQQANSEVRKLELLREQDHRAWSLGLAKTEQRLLDERATRAVAALVKP